MIDCQTTTDPLQRARCIDPDLNDAVVDFDTAVRAMNTVTPENQRRWEFEYRHVDSGSWAEASVVDCNLKTAKDAYDPKIRACVTNAFVDDYIELSRVYLDRQARPEPFRAMMARDDEARAVCDETLFSDGGGKGVGQVQWSPAVTFADENFGDYGVVEQATVTLGDSRAPQRIFQYVADPIGIMPEAFWIFPRPDGAAAFLDDLKDRRDRGRAASPDNPLRGEADAASDFRKQLPRITRHPAHNPIEDGRVIGIFSPGAMDDEKAPALYQAANTDLFKGTVSASEAIMFRDRVYVTATSGRRAGVFRFKAHGELETLCWMRTAVELDGAFIDGNF